MPVVVTISQTFMRVLVLRICKPYGSESGKDSGCDIEIPTYVRWYVCIQR